MAAGDIDNDGRLDLFQAVPLSFEGAGLVSELEEVKFRPIMLLNIGEGQFLDVTEGTGLSALIGKFSWAPRLADIDNDGDVDLLFTEMQTSEGFPSFLFSFNLFLNNGDVTFADHSDRSGIGEVGINGSLGDYDLDGFLDILWTEAFSLSESAPVHIFRNNGNEHHWLGVELVGVESNRRGIGTQLIATAGELQQIREILGGTGHYQEELVAHFGLGSRLQVDRLEIHWPSGQLDVLTGIAADQRIRVFEGREDYHTVHPTVWEIAPPGSLVVGTTVRFSVAVRPALFEAGARITRVAADLSSLGGPEDALLEPGIDGTYQLEAGFTVWENNGIQEVKICIDQETSLGLHWITLTKNIAVVETFNSAVVEEHVTVLPQSFALEQNYPNPFNSSTTMQFSLPASDEVELAVYNLMGQQVAKLVEGRREAGVYTLHWDARNLDGGELASGVYVYRLRAGEQVETRKLLLLQ